MPGLMEIDIDTPRGPARAHLQPAPGSTAAIVLGHGAGGGIAAPDLVAAAEAAAAQGLSVALVEQPYRVAGRRAPAPAAQLDDCWRIVIAHLLAGELRAHRLIVGGRSLGARVACRTSGEAGAVGVLCLAFPLQPPQRRGAKPAQSRLGELEAVSVPMLVIQGKTDPFGLPAPAPDRRVVQVKGDHSLRSDPDAIRDAVGSWLTNLL
jgi:predicted alpha/beta-hydrolase family hydrolase